MKIKTSELIGPALDWAVATALGHKAGQIKAHGPVHLFRGIGYSPYQFSPSTSGSEVIEIMEREKIDVEFRKQSFGDSIPHWYASHLKNEGGLIRYHGHGSTIRIAVCLCFCAAKLGDEVNVPEELMK